MSRKVIVKTEIELTFNVDEGVKIGEILNEMAVRDTTTKADILDINILDWRVIDSK
jgi:hypothetical protein